MMKKLLLVALMLFSASFMVAQTTISGTVKDAALGEGIPGANIKVARKSVGTSTDFDGKFTMTVTDTPPFTIEVSSLGYQTKSVEITQNNQVVEVSLTENATSLDEVVVSASRTPERIMESPVTIERMDARAIRDAASPSFYDALENLKGIDINSGSLTFKSINSRGFATFGNERFMQLVDGMDNAAPGLNFAIGNLLGISDLDVKTVEVLPGASSALYGANAFNGIMFMTSKNPFDNQGISVSLKGGVTSQDAGGDNQFYDVGIRMAHAFDEYFAAKATMSYLEGTEWYATDYRNINPNQDGYISGNRFDTPNYDGVNVYGDDFSQTLDFEQIALANSVPAPIAAAMGSASVTRTGYTDVDLMDDYKAKSLKFNGSLHYRPWGNDRLEVIWNSKFGRGNTIYQGQSRYNIKNFFLEQHRLEFRGKNFFLRGYMTAEDSGDSYDTRFAAININRRWKSDRDWFTQYAQGFIGAFTGQVPGVTPGNSALAHAAARSFADAGRFVPGTPEFQAAFNDVTNDPSLLTGSKFNDQTKLYHVDGNLNLRDYIDWAEIQVGGSYREYVLNSNGTIFTDANGAIRYDEFGVYTQLQKKFLEDDRLKLTASIRYDKAKNFDGNFSPRVSLAYAAGSNKNHNFRGSYQTGFRNPTTQDQYIGLDAGSAILIGTAADNLDRYVSNPFDLTTSLPAAAVGFINGAYGLDLGGSTSITGRQAFENSWTLSSLLAFAATGGADATVLRKSNVDLVKPEKVQAFELGYRGAFDKISVDINGYYNIYEDFIASELVVAPLYGQAFDLSNPATAPGAGELMDLTPIGGGAAVPKGAFAIGQGHYKVFALDSNSSADVSSYGASIGINAKILDGFNLGASYTWSQFDFDQASDPDFEAGFNTPEHNVKLQFGNSNLFENFGFNVSGRWQSEYLWESSFHDAMIDSRTVIDAQVNYRVPSIKSTFKLGGTNLTGEEFIPAPGAGAVGSQYYLSWTINN